VAVYVLASLLLQTNSPSTKLNVGSSLKPIYRPHVPGSLQEKEGEEEENGEEEEEEKEGVTLSWTPKRLAHVRHGQISNLLPKRHCVVRWEIRRQGKQLRSY
jgi:hypothetical protein